MTSDFARLIASQTWPFTHEVDGLMYVSGDGRNWLPWSIDCEGFPPLRSLAQRAYRAEVKLDAIRRLCEQEAERWGYVRTERLREVLEEGNHDR